MSETKHLTRAEVESEDFPNSPPDPINVSQLCDCINEYIPRADATILALADMLRNEVAYHSGAPGNCGCRPCVWLRRFDGLEPAGHA